MTWVTWRQHRAEGAWVLVFTALVALGTAFIAIQLRAATCPASGESMCSNEDLAGQLAQSLVKFNLFSYGLVVLPALAGAFIGAPLVGRELESATYRLAWTQGVTRRRWLLVKVVLVILPLLVAAAIVGIVEVFLIDSQNAHPNHWAWFDQQAPMTVASTLFAMALGIALGTVISRLVEH